MSTSSALDEISDRLTVIYNKMRFLRDDIKIHSREMATAQQEFDRLERVAEEYVALLAPEGIPASIKEKIA